MTKTEIDRFGHAAAGAPSRLRVSGGKISFYLFVGPRAYAGLVVRGDVVSLPPVDDRSGVLPSALRREQQVAGRVTIAAVRERFGQIRSAIPCRVVGARRFHRPVGMNRSFQALSTYRWLNGKDERVVGVPQGHRLHSRKVGTDGKNVIGRQKGTLVCSGD